MTNNMNNHDFAPLDAMDIGYHKLVRDVCNYLKAQGIIFTISESPVAAATIVVAATHIAAAATSATVAVALAQGAASATIIAEVAEATADALEAKNAKAIVIIIMDESL
ncbi:hypothetical protein M0R45_006447 [Rubus argutus]|uniref:Uncharacterized protein n=1 Tax=Rubus argutus TaxID=59490 RepID=A0AAW1YQE5_RUBAR